MRQSHPRRATALAATLISVLVLAGCFGSDSSTFAPTEPKTSSDSGRTRIDNSSSDRRPTKAAKFLPDFSGASFQVEDIDLAAKTKPLGMADALIETAIGDDAAPGSRSPGSRRTARRPRSTRPSKWRARRSDA